MYIWLEKTRELFKKRSFLISTLLGFVFLALSVIVNFYAGSYATIKASNPVTDIVLSNIRVYDVDGIFVYGAIIFWIFVILVSLLVPKRLPFTLKSIALFTIIRSIFISLTHIGPFPTQLIIENSKLMQKFAFGADLFFSGHTGLPFLMALIFWHNKYLRWVFIATSLMFGTIVLMGHIHYSIDVLSAFFITYTIFSIAVVLFKKDRELFLS